MLQITVMTELRYLQLVILGILKDIDFLCLKHSIAYYLLSGSATDANGLMGLDLRIYCKEWSGMC